MSIVKEDATKTLPEMQLSLCIEKWNYLVSFC